MSAPPESPMSPSTVLSKGVTLVESEFRCETCAEQSPGAQPGLVTSELGGGVDTLQGWPGLARLLAVNTDLQAFPTFTELNIKSLLYYQAELVILEKDLHEVEWRDQRDTTGAHNELSQRVDFLISSDDDGDNRARMQIKLIKRIRVVLDKYSNTPTLLFTLFDPYLRIEC
jgi:hypothetical protein